MSSTFSNFILYFYIPIYTIKWNEQEHRDLNPNLWFWRPLFSPLNYTPINNRKSMLLKYSNALPTELHSKFMEWWDLNPRQLACPF